MQLGRMLNYSLVLFFALGLAGCSKPTPVKNPNPKYSVTVRGVISPALKKPIYLGFKVTYAAYAKNCATWVDSLEGIKGMHAHVDYYIAQPNTKGEYKVDIPIDRYKPGRCDWKIAYIDYNYTNTPLTKRVLQDMQFGGLMQFGTRKDAVPAMPMKAYSHAKLYRCNDGVKYCLGSTLSGNVVDQVSRNKNYSFGFSFMR